jgi:hypothetical protein
MRRFRAAAAAGATSAPAVAGVTPAEATEGIVKVIRMWTHYDKV